jgi:hypothetical protein
VLTVADHLMNMIIPCIEMPLLQMAIQRREKHNMRSILGVFASAKKLAKFSGPSFDGYSTSKGNNKEEVGAL